LLSTHDRLLMARLKQHLGSRVLEVGPGIGNMTQHLLDRELVVAVDADRENVRQLRSRFRNRPNLVCLHMDITQPRQDLGQWNLDSVLCANVLEHIADDVQALKQITHALPEGGTVVILVPAGPRLYSDMDVSAGHLRRYSTEELRSKSSHAGLVVSELWQWNAAGALGWLVNGKLLRRSTISDWQLRLFNWMAWPLITLETRILRGVGLSLVAVCRKPTPSGH
jgi:SAM-dependent methyltransferase